MSACCCAEREEWRAHLAYRHYDVSSRGRVRHGETARRWRLRIVTVHIPKSGVPYCRLKHHGANKHVAVSTLVADTFLERLYSARAVPRDGNPGHVCSANLDVVPYARPRKRHRYDVGIEQRNAAILAGFRVRYAGHAEYMRLADIFMVSPSTIEKVCQEAVRTRKLDVSERTYATRQAEQHYKRLRKARVRAEYNPAIPNDSALSLAIKHGLNKQTVMLWCKDIRLAYVAGNRELVEARRSAQWQQFKQLADMFFPHSPHHGRRI